MAGDAINWFLDFFTGDSEQTVQAVKDSDGSLRTMVQKQAPGCTWGDTAPVRQHLTRPELRIYDEVNNAINSGANTVNIGGHTFGNVPGPDAPFEQQAAFAKVAYNTVNNTTINDQDVNNILNQTAYGGGDNIATIDQNVASGDGAVAADDITNSALATGDRSVAGAGGSDVVGATGDGSSAAQSQGSGSVVSQAGGGGDVNQVDDSNLAGVSFGDGGSTVGAAPGGVAAGGDAANAGPGSTIAQDGGVAAGQDGSVGTAATTGGGVDQSVSVDASNTQVAGGNIDQSATVAGDDVIEDSAAIDVETDVAIEDSFDTA